MKGVIAVMTREDALEAHRGGASFLSVKNIQEGSLGANLPRVIREIRKAVPRRVAVGAALGDYHDRMAGVVAQAAVGAIVSGARHHVTAGLRQISSKEEASLIIKNLSEIKDSYPDVSIAVGAYADHEKLGSISPWDVLELLKGSKIDIVVIDVQSHEEGHLFELMPPPKLQEFIGKSHRYGLSVVLLGSLGVENVQTLIESGTDMMGVRGSVCEGGRLGRVSAQKVRALLRTIEHHQELYTKETPSGIKSLLLRIFPRS